MTNKTLKEEIHELLRYGLAPTPPNAIHVAGDYSDQIMALIQSRLDSIEWPEKTEYDGPVWHPRQWCRRNEAITSCQQAVNKAFGVE